MVANMRFRGAVSILWCTFLLSACPASSVAAVSAPTARFDARQIAKRLSKLTGALAVVPAAEPAAADAAQELDAFSRGCREAGAAAVCLTFVEGVRDNVFAEALARVSAEQHDAANGFPGPCPVFVRAAGALSADQLQLFTRSGMDALVLPAECVHEYAAVAGGLPLVAEVESAGGAAGAPAASAADSPPALSLQRIGALELNAGEVQLAQNAHASGSRAVLLDYGAELLPEGDCDEYLSAVLRAMRTKRSTSFESSAFGGLPADGSSPEKRNPKLWRRAQKEAKEIMSDSKKKYGHLDKKL